VTDQEKAPLVVRQPEGPLGVHGDATQLALQQDVFKELVNKLAWVLGSTYRTPYSNRHMKARQLAIKLATRLVSQEGWPRQIQK